jgi:putative SOS response-associated peptidase YedK
MCGRYVLATPVSDLAEYFSAQIDPSLLENFQPSWNVPPASGIAAITANRAGERHIDRLRWGLVPIWARDLSFGAKTINARAETVATKPTFRSAFRSQRCIIPADGYYEWKTTAGEVKQPYYFTRRDGMPLAFAGLWERFDLRHEGETTTTSIFTCAIITAEANQDVEEIHNRMPVVLEQGPFWDQWLDGAFANRDALLKMCQPAPTGTLMGRRVATSVNSVRNDRPELIEELLERPSLF